MGDVNKVGLLQTEFEAIIKNPPQGGGGLTLEEEVVFNPTSPHSLAAVVNLCVVITEITRSTDRMEVLTEAVHILDSLDTLGMELRFKQ